MVDVLSIILNLAALVALVYSIVTVVGATATFSGRLTRVSDPTWFGSRWIRVSVTPYFLTITSPVRGRQLARFHRRDLDRACVFYDPDPTTLPAPLSRTPTSLTVGALPLYRPDADPLPPQAWVPLASTTEDRFFLPSDLGLSAALESCPIVASASTFDEAHNPYRDRLPDHADRWYRRTLGDLEVVAHRHGFESSLSRIEAHRLDTGEVVANTSPAAISERTLVLDGVHYAVAPLEPFCDLSRELSAADVSDPDPAAAPPISVVASMGPYPGPLLPSEWVSLGPLALSGTWSLSPPPTSPLTDFGNPAGTAISVSLAAFPSRAALAHRPVHDDDVIDFYVAGHSSGPVDTLSDPTSQVPDATVRDEDVLYATEPLFTDKATLSPEEWIQLGPAFGLQSNWSSPPDEWRLPTPEVCALVDTVRAIISDNIDPLGVPARLRPLHGVDHGPPPAPVVVPSIVALGISTDLSRLVARLTQDFPEWSFAPIHRWSTPERPPRIFSHLSAWATAIANAHTILDD